MQNATDSVVDTLTLSLKKRRSEAISAGNEVYPISNPALNENIFAFDD